MRREIFRQGDPRFAKSRESVRQRQSNGYRPPCKPLSIGDAPEVGLSDLSVARNSSSLSSKRGSAVRNLLWESPLSFVQDLFNKVRTAGCKLAWQCQVTSGQSISLTPKGWIGSPMDLHFHTNSQSRDQFTQSHCPKTGPLQGLAEIEGGTAALLQCFDLIFRSCIFGTGVRFSQSTRK